MRLPKHLVRCWIDGKYYLFDPKRFITVNKSKSKRSAEASYLEAAEWQDSYFKSKHEKNKKNKKV